MDKKQFTNEMRQKCRADFPAIAYKQHPTKTFLTTLKAMYVTERLNDVFGVGRWTIHTEVIERTNDYILLQGEFESRDYDVIVPKQFGGHITTGKGTEIADGYKSAFTDCMSKISSYFEIGIDMFMGKINVKAATKGQTEKATTKIETLKETEWLTEEQFNKAINSGMKGINATIKAYSFNNGKAMKKEYKAKLEAKLNTLSEIAIEQSGITYEDIRGG